MLSYPNGLKDDLRNLNRPDMAVMGTLAEAARLDIRMIILVREASAVLNSTLDHRHFGKQQPQILVANAESMYAQQRLLHRAFYRCVHYDDLAHHRLNASQKAALVNFLHPRLLNTDVMEHLLDVVYSAAQPAHIAAALKPAIKLLTPTPNTTLLPFSAPMQHRHSDWDTEEGRLNRAYQTFQLQSRINLIERQCWEQQAWLK